MGPRSVATSQPRSAQSPPPHRRLRTRGGAPRRCLAAPRSEGEGGKASRLRSGGAAKAASGRLKVLRADRGSSLGGGSLCFGVKMPAVSKGDGMRGLAVFISDIRNCKRGRGGEENLPPARRARRGLAGFFGWGSFPSRGTRSVCLFLLRARSFPAEAAPDCLGKGTSAGNVGLGWLQSVMRTRLSWEGSSPLSPPTAFWAGNEPPSAAGVSFALAEVGGGRGRCL